MNSYIRAITSFDLETVEKLIERRPAWIDWSEPSGKNALHYLCGVVVGTNKARAGQSLKILKRLLKLGMDMNSLHRIPDERCEFPPTPLWYAYTKGRNETLYKYLLKSGADPSGCWWAMAWFDDVPAAKLWQRHGAIISERPTLNELFIGAFQWKRYRFADWVLDEGADVDSRGPFGETALMLAVKRKEEQMISKLLKRGADPDLLDNAGCSARSIAISRGPKRLVGLLDSR